MGRGECELRQNRQEGYEVQEGEEQEAQVLRGRQVGEKCKICAWAIKNRITCRQIYCGYAK